jgi:hypothetical protein
MLPRTAYITLGVFAFIHLQTRSYSQQLLSDTAFLAASKEKVVSLYAASIQQQSRLYNGTDYVMYSSRDEEHPYFSIDDWTFGSIVYWHEQYENVPVMYDLSTDQVITEHNRGNPIKLIGEKVDGFTISDHVFERLRSNGTDNITEGFYEKLYGGRSKVYAKHQKLYREDLTSKEVIPRFEEISRYFVLKDSALNNVKTKSSIIEVFEDRKQEIKTFIKKNKLRFREKKYVAIVRVAEFYDSLND